MAPGVERKRPAPPPDLTPEQAAEWIAIVETMPGDWFRRENFALLAQYVRHIVTARWLAGHMDRLESSQRPNLKLYEQLRRAREAESKMLRSLATAMRLSQHASYDKKKSKGPTLPAPWED